MRRPLRFGSVCTGIGAMDKGFVKVEMEHMFMCEIDPLCVPVLEEQFPGVPIFGDVRQMKKLPFDIDILIAGFPCQDVSMFQKDRLGLEGTETVVVKQIIRLLETAIKDGKPVEMLLEPRMCAGFAENVEGILYRLANGDAVILFLYSELDRLGYRFLAHRVISLAGLAGASTRRRRVLFGGGYNVDIRDILLTQNFTCMGHCKETFGEPCYICYESYLASLPEAERNAETSYCIDMANGGLQGCYAKNTSPSFLSSNSKLLCVTESDCFLMPIEDRERMFGLEEGYTAAAIPPLPEPRPQQPQQRVPAVITTPAPRPPPPPPPPPTSPTHTTPASTSTMLTRGRAPKPPESPPIAPQPTNQQQQEEEETLPPAQKATSLPRGDRIRCAMLANAVPVQISFWLAAKIRDLGLHKYVPCGVEHIDHLLGKPIPPHSPFKGAQIKPQVYSPEEIAEIAGLTNDGEEEAAATTSEQAYYNLRTHGAVIMKKKQEEVMDAANNGVLKVGGRNTGKGLDVSLAGQTVPKCAFYVDGIGFLAVFHVGDTPFPKSFVPLHKFVTRGRSPTTQELISLFNRMQEQGILPCSDLYQKLSDELGRRSHNVLTGHYVKIQRLPIAFSDGELIGDIFLKEMWKEKGVWWPVEVFDALNMPLAGRICTEALKLLSQAEKEASVRQFYKKTSRSEDRRVLIRFFNASTKGYWVHPNELVPFEISNNGVGNAEIKSTRAKLKGKRLLKFNVAARDAAQLKEIKSSTGTSCIDFAQEKRRQLAARAATIAKDSKIACGTCAVCIQNRGISNPSAAGCVYARQLASALNGHTGGTLAICGARAIGMYVALYWANDNKFYPGYIVYYNPQSKVHAVVYEDGDLGIYDLGSISELVVVLKDKPDVKLAREWLRLCIKNKRHNVLGKKEREAAKDVKRSIAAAEFEELAVEAIAAETTDTVRDVLYTSAAAAAAADPGRASTSKVGGKKAGSSNVAGGTSGASTSKKQGGGIFPTKPNSVDDYMPLFTTPSCHKCGHKVLPGELILPCECKQCCVHARCVEYDEKTFGQPWYCGVHNKDNGEACVDHAAVERGGVGFLEQLPMEVQKPMQAPDGPHGHDADSDSDVDALSDDSDDEMKDVPQQQQQQQLQQEEHQEEEHQEEEEEADGSEDSPDTESSSDISVRAHSSEEMNDITQPQQEQCQEEEEEEEQGDGSDDDSDDYDSESNSDISVRAHSSDDETHPRYHMKKRRKRR